MDNLNMEELKQLVNFYKQRYIDLEFVAVQNQLIIPRIIKEKENLESLNASLQSKVDSLISENDLLKNKVSASKKIKNK